jgi:hypothetical protein
MATLDETVKAVAALARGVTGVRAAPNYPPDKADIFPFAVAVPDEGELQFVSAGFGKGLHTLALEVHVQRKDLATDIAAAMGLFEGLRTALLSDPTLGGKVSSYGPIRYQFQAMDWAGVGTIGWRFRLENMKILY